MVEEANVVDYLKLGTAQYTYLLDLSLEESLQQIKQIGFRYIELMTAPPHFWPPSFLGHDRKNLRNTLDELGFELTAINPTYLDINLASLNPGMRAESVKQILDQITLAADLGAELIVVIPGKRHPLMAESFDDVWRKYARESVCRCVEHAEKKGVVFGLENGPSLFVDDAEKMLFVLDEVKSSHLKIVFDVANASMVEPVEQALDKVRDHLVHVHLSDTDGTKWTHSPVGQGTIDFGAVAAQLKAMDYGGISVLETTYREDATRGITSSIEKLSALGWCI